MLKLPQLEALKHSVLLPARLLALQRRSLTWAWPRPESPAALTLTQRQNSAAVVLRSL